MVDEYGTSVVACGPEQWMLIGIERICIAAAYATAQGEDAKRIARESITQIMPRLNEISEVQYDALRSHLDNYPKTEPIHALGLTYFILDHADPPQESSSTMYDYLQQYVAHFGKPEFDVSTQVGLAKRS